MRLNQRRLALETLEARDTPATIAYNAALQTLTVTADSNDTLTVAQAAGRPAGFLTVNDGTSTVFNATRFVKNLILDARADSTSSVSLAANTRLAGSLTVRGGGSSSAFTLGDGCSLGGGLTYFGSAGTDQASLGASCSVVGAVTLHLGAGGGQAQLRGRLGSLKVTGGSGDESISLAAAASLSIAGAAVFGLGAGTNTVVTADPCQIGGSLTYTGGTGADTFQVGTAEPLFVAGNLTLNLEPPNGFGTNGMLLNSLKVGGTVSIAGGKGTDTLTVGDDVFIAKDLIASLGAGRNTGTLAGGTAGTRVMGRLRWVGGAGEDRVSVSNLLVGRHLLVALGDNTAPVNGQGCEVSGTVQVLGSVGITGGAQADIIQLDGAMFVERALTVNGGASGPDVIQVLGGVRVSGATTLVTAAGNDLVEVNAALFLGTFTASTGAGNDTVRFDQSNVFGTTVINTAAGNDLIAIETLAQPNVSTFGSAVAFLGGTGDDVLRVSTGTGPAQFGGRVKLDGGVGNDQMDLGTTVVTTPPVGTW
jgi:hypothetical protein